MTQVKMPEPVAYLIDWPDEIELGLYFSEEKNDSARSRPLITTEQAEAYAQARVDAAVERAKPTYYSDGYQAGWNSALEQAARIADHNSWLAAAIRALKREQP